MTAVVLGRDVERLIVKLVHGEPFSVDLVDRAADGSLIAWQAAPVLRFRGSPADLVWTATLDTPQTTASFAATAAQVAAVSAFAPRSVSLTLGEIVWAHGEVTFTP